MSHQNLMPGGASGAGPARGLWMATPGACLGCFNRHEWRILRYTNIAMGYIARFMGI